MTDLSKQFWETTYKQNIGKMTGICYRYVADARVAEDLAHDAFLIAIDKSSGFEGRGPFEAWLRRIVVNVALQYLREQKKKKYLEDWTTYNNDAMETGEDKWTEDENDFSEEELLEVVNRLPEHHKLVFNLYVLDKFTHLQIARELGISEGTSKSHLARARKKIRMLLEIKLKEKKDKKRGVLMFFMVPFKLWNIDRVYKKRFEDFSVQPGSELSFDSIDFGKYTVPGLRTPARPYLKFGVLAATLGSVAILALHLSDAYESERVAKRQAYQPGSKDGRVEIAPVHSSEKAKTSFSIPQPAPLNQDVDLFSDSTDATLSEKSIIVGENINNIMNKKKLNAIGALLLAGSGFAADSGALYAQKAELNAGKGQVILQSGNSPALEIGGPANKRKPGPVRYDSGTFRASSLRWSGEDNELHFDGEVVVNVGENNFVGVGSFTFLGKVYYLVLEGNPVEINTNLRLSDKKYALRHLSPKAAMKKYGENGKQGVVEIEPAR